MNVIGTGIEGPLVTFECRLCNFRTLKYHSAWRKHLLLESHQDKARDRVKLLDIQTKRRTVVIFGLSSIKSKDVLKYFGDLAVVTDFIYWKERPDFCILTVLYHKFRNTMVLNNHVIHSRKIFLRALDEIPEAEWISICPFAAHPREIDVDSGDANDDPFKESSDDEPMSDADGNESWSAHSYNAYGNGIIVNQNTPQSSHPLPPPSPDSSSVNEGRKDHITKSGIISNDSQEQHNFNFSLSNFEHDGEIIEESQFDHSISKFDKDSIVSNSNNGAESLSSGETNYTDKAKLLNSMMEKFYDRNLMPSDKWDVRNIVKQHIETILRTILPKCVLVPFGVGSTAISSGREILSIYIDIFGGTSNDSGNPHIMDVDEENNQDIIQKILKVLGQSHLRTEVCELKTFDDKIVFTYIPTGPRLRSSSVQCKLQATNFLAVQCCRILNFICTLDDRVRALLIIVRHWAYHNHLVMSNPGDRQPKDLLHPSVLQWLVIFFMTHKNIIPSIETLQENANTPLVHGGENIAFCNNIEQLEWSRKTDFEQNPDTGNPSAVCVLQLAQEMFAYFGSTKVNRSVISVNTGVAISRKSVLNQEEGFKGPFQSPAAWNCTRGLVLRRPMIVQHPLKLYVNMTVEIPSHTEKLFRLQCRYTAERLQSLLTNDSVQENPIAVLVSSENSNVDISSNCSDVIIVHPPERVPNNVTSIDGDRTAKLLKIKDFDLELSISGKLLKRTKQFSENKSDIFSKKCLEEFEHFNKAVWPACFGVELYELPDMNPCPLPPPWKALVASFQGVITNSEMFESVLESNSKIGTHRLKMDLRRKMRRATKKRSITGYSGQSLTLSNKKLSSFRCQVSSHTKGKESTIFLHFTNILYCHAAPETFEKNVIAVYRDLWKHYCTDLKNKLLNKLDKLEKISY